MTASAPVSFWEYRQRLKRRLTEGPGARAAEPESPYDGAHPAALNPVSERLVQTIWAQGLFSPDGMRTVDGRALRVLEPGRWNGAAGPDFKGARLLLGPDTVDGDVEIHLIPADWLAHGHQRDLDYNRVVLHVVLNNPDGGADDPLHNGKRVPRLELEPFIFPDLETLRRSLSPDDYQYAQPEGLGRCHRLMAELPPAEIADFLDRAGDERLTAKMHRLAEQAQSAELEQVFHQAVMMTLGAGPGRTLYYLLARRTPLKELMDFARELEPSHWNLGIETLLVHVAGLAPAAGDLANAPGEARDRAAALARLWGRFAPYWRDRLIPPTRRWFQGIRPVNFPVRRLAGVALLLARAMRKGQMPLADLCDRIERAAPSLAEARPSRRRHPLIAELTDWFRVSGEGHFWGTHYSFTAKPSPRTMDLIGESTARTLVFNALLPAALLRARHEKNDRLEEAARRLYGLIPPLPPNHITQFMTRRLFGTAGPGAGLFTTERRQQALFQIFHHCCQAEERHCDACYYFRPD